MYSDTTQIDTLISRIKAWETAVINNPVISTYEEGMLLSGGSTARYSSVYWFSESKLGTSSAWYGISCNQQPQALMAWPWNIIAADIGGALLGYEASGGSDFWAWVVGGACSLAEALK